MRLRPALAIGLIALTSAIAHPHNARAQITRPYSADGQAVIGPGVDYEWGSLDLANGGRQNINIVELDPADPRTQLHVSQTDGVASHRRTVVEQDAAYSQDGRRVVASVNGSLFSFMRYGDLSDAGGALLGAGLGINVSDGELINAGVPPERNVPVPAVGVDASGAAKIGEPQIDISLTLPGGSSITVDRINQPRFDGDVVLYTPRWDTHTRTDALGSEYVIEGFALPIATTATYTGTVVEVRHGAGDTAIGPDQVVLSVSSTTPPWPGTLAVGSAVTVAVAIDASWASATQIVSGRDMLVINGSSVVPQPNTDGRHARTAVGISATGKVILLTADSGTFKYGISLTDAAQLMLSLGTVNAVNLDGGVSTQMTVRLPGDIGTTAVATINKPTDRAVVNSLQVVSHAPDGPLATLLLTPPERVAATGETVEFVAKGQDDDLNGVALDPSTLDWSVDRVGGGAVPMVEETASGISVTSSVHGDYLVTVRTGVFEATAQLTFGNDTKAPVVAGLSAAIGDSGSVGKDNASVAFGWSAVDNVAIQSVQVQRRIGSGDWANVAVAPTATAASSAVGFGKQLTFRVRATDTAGNTSQWLLSNTYRLDLYDDASQQISRTGSWNRKSAAGAIGGKYLRSKSNGATIGLAYNGLQVAVIGSRGPTHGLAEITLDDVAQPPVNLDASVLELRQVLFVTPVKTSMSANTIGVRNAGTAQDPLMDVDAFLVLVVVP